MKLKWPCQRSSTSSSSTGAAVADTHPGLEEEEVGGTYSVDVAVAHASERHSNSTRMPCTIRWCFDKHKATAHLKHPCEDVRVSAATCFVIVVGTKILFQHRSQSKLEPGLRQLLESRLWELWELWLQ